MDELPATLSVFHSGSGVDLDEALQAGPGRPVRARKRTHPVQVRFAQQPCTVDTLEGVVPAKLGDAIVTGLFGETWPVSTTSFARRYQAVAPVEMGSPGLYLTLPIEVLAVSMNTPFEVVLDDGHSRLRGQPGDWLIDYDDGKLGIVSAAIFDASYEIVGD